MTTVYVLEHLIKEINNVQNGKFTISHDSIFFYVRRLHIRSISSGEEEITAIKVGRLNRARLSLDHSSLSIDDTLAHV